MFGFGKERKLYRIEITEDVQYFSETSLIAMRFRNPLERLKEGIIKKGVKGEIITKWGRKYFSPDTEQEDIGLFTSYDQPYILVSYKKVIGHYKIID